MQNLISTGHAAAILGVSRERVLDFIRQGRLKVAARDGFGRRLLRRAAVETLRLEREQRANSARALGRR